jgi:hypothetical protein
VRLERTTTQRRDRPNDSEIDRLASGPS